jgi:hypothetical protein
MWILPLVGYVGAVIGFCFLTLAIASGLYYMSELVEEHSVLAKRLLTRLIYAIIFIQTLLWLVDGFPFWASMLGIVSHVIYLGNMRRFPFVRLSDPLFLTSCGTSSSSPDMARNIANDGYSSRAGQPLCLVPTLLRHTDSILPAILVLRQGRRAELHSDRVVLWALRVACPFRALRELVGWRQCSSYNGNRTCSWC